MQIPFQLSFNSVVWSLLNYYLLIVQYSDPGNVFQVFLSRKEGPITWNLESINIKSSTRLAYFCLLLWRLIATIDLDFSGIYGTYFSDWGQGRWNRKVARPGMKGWGRETISEGNWEMKIKNRRKLSTAEKSKKARTKNRGKCNKRGRKEECKKGGGVRNAKARGREEIARWLGGGGGRGELLAEMRVETGPPYTHWGHNERRVISLTAIKNKTHVIRRMMPVRGTQAGRKRRG